MATNVVTPQASRIPIHISRNVTALKMNSACAGATGSRIAAPTRAMYAMNGIVSYKNQSSCII
jgi:hypothetical protein